jgi:hypothetical protein
MENVFLLALGMKINKKSPDFRGRRSAIIMKRHYDSWALAHYRLRPTIRGHPFSSVNSVMYAALTAASRLGHG